MILIFWYRAVLSGMVANRTHSGQYSLLQFDFRVSFRKVGGNSQAFVIQRENLESKDFGVSGIGTTSKHLPTRAVCGQHFQTRHTPLRLFIAR